MNYRRGSEDLVPLSHFAGRNPTEADKLRRLQNAWPQLVGQGLSRMTHPISIAGGRLLIGCHDTSTYKSMKASAATSWPVLRDRINAAVGTHLQSVDVTPSDPPKTADPPEKNRATDTAPPLTKEDPFARCLDIIFKTPSGKQRTG